MVDASVFRVRKKLSETALSQFVPLRLMLCVMPCCSSANRWLSKAYRLSLSVSRVSLCGFTLPDARASKACIPTPTKNSGVKHSFSCLPLIAKTIGLHREYTHLLIPQWHTVCRLVFVQYNAQIISGRQTL